MVPYLFRFGWAAVSNLTKSFVLSAHSVENRVQNIRTESFRVFVMSDDFAQRHSALDCKFVSVLLGAGPGGLSESPDNPAFFHRGTHSGF